MEEEGRLKGEKMRRRENKWKGEGRGKMRKMKRVRKWVEAE